MRTERRPSEVPVVGLDMVGATENAATENGVTHPPTVSSTSEEYKAVHTLSKTDTPNKEFRRFRSLPCNIGCSAWCKKYFWEGQKLSESYVRSVENIDENTSWARRFLARYRKVIAMVFPALLTHFVWWSVMIKYGYWYFFEQKWYMSITMVFGSLIAGMTSEGGGAVAFPVMTLAFGISPKIARDFSMAIQACGMSAATFVIFFMRVKLEWSSLIYCSLGGAFGLILGLEFVDHLMTPPQKKMAFVSVWFSFAFTLFLLNRYGKRKTYDSVPEMKAWKAIVLVITGIVGGLFTSFAGSGLDICSFSILTLLFRISEKTATPTSVCLMAFNSIIGAFWRHIMMEGIAFETWQFFAVCVEIVVIGAPLGSVIGTHFHRQVLAGLIYIIDIVSLVSAYILVKQTALLAGMSVGIIVGGFLFFYGLTRLGEKLYLTVERNAAKNMLIGVLGNVGLDANSKGEKSETNGTTVVISGQENEAYEEPSTEQSTEQSPDVSVATNCSKI